jgi:hypothetical protein
MSLRHDNQVIVVLLPDGGEKYISTELYDDRVPAP